MPGRCYFAGHLAVLNASVVARRAHPHVIFRVERQSREVN
jgi:hypothetical protein